MTIPTGENAQILGGQTDLATIKAAFKSLIDRANAMYDLRTDAPSRNACMDARGGAERLLGMVEEYDAGLSRSMMATYPMSDIGPIITGGGGGRR